MTKTRIGLETRIRPPPLRKALCESFTGGIFVFKSDTKVILGMCVRKRVLTGEAATPHASTASVQVAAWLQIQTLFLKAERSLRGVVPINLAFSQTTCHDATLTPSSTKRTSRAFAGGRRGNLIICWLNYLARRHERLAEAMPPICKLFRTQPPELPVSLRSATHSSEKVDSPSLCDA